MDNALYVGLSRQMVLQRQLDIAANNLANIDTAGFKVESLMQQTDPLGGSKQDQAKLLGPVKYALDNGVARNFGQGGVDRSANTYDVAIQGDGFFPVQTAQGVRYTRDGQFRLDDQNRLVTKAGDLVGDGITVDPTGSAPTIAKDGTVSQTDIHGAVTQIGKLRAVRFANLAGLSKQGDNLYASDETPSPATDVTLTQGAVERSNVQPMLEINNLIDITRAYERVAQMMSSNEDLSKSAVERLGKAA